jgi:hypothetical protein
MERLLSELAQRGFVLRPDAQEELSARGESMSLAEITDFVLRAEGLAEPAYEKRLRGMIREAVAKAENPN